jgi:hypothetical protein
MSQPCMNVPTNRASYVTLYGNVFLTTCYGCVSETSPPTYVLSTLRIQFDIDFRLLYVLRGRIGGSDSSETLPWL